MITDQHILYCYYPVVLEYYMSQVNKTSIPTELGPWMRGISYKEADDLDEAKEFIQPNNAHLHKRTYLKLPSIMHTERNTLSTKKSKHLLKMSHQSLDLAHATLNQTSNKSRYGALNGSLLHTKGKGGGLQWKSVELATGRHKHETIDFGNLDRKISMVQMGEPVVNRQNARGLKRKLMNEQCAKKRSLMQFIRQMNHNKQMMDYYLLHKGQRMHHNRIFG